MEEHKAYINFLCQHGVFQLTLGSWLGSITLPLVSSTLYTGCGVDDCPASVAADRLVVYGGPRGLISPVLNNCRWTIVTIKLRFYIIVLTNAVHYHQ